MAETEHPVNPFEGISLDEAHKLRGWLENTGAEVYPSDKTLEKIRLQKPGMPISITSSPANGMGLSKRFAVDLLNEGVDVIPHLGARNIEDGELEGLLKSFKDLGIKKFLVVAGDNKVPRGRFKSSIQLLEAMATLGFIPQEIDIAGYPRKHPFISERERDRAIDQKQNFAEKHGVKMGIRAQICLSTEHIARFVQHLRDIEIALPVTMGVLGPVNLESANAHLKEIGVNEIEPVLNRLKSGSLLEDLSIFRFKPEDYLKNLVKDAGEFVNNIYFYTFGAYNMSLASIASMKTSVQGIS